MADGVATVTAIDTGASRDHAGESRVHPDRTNGTRRGRLRLGPIEGSSSTDVLDVEIELARPDACLTLGDLRRAAVAHTEGNLQEEAHRLWAAVAVAAASLGAPQLEEMARQRVLECHRPPGPLVEEQDRVAERFRRSHVRYDYLAIAADRAAGLSAAQTSAEHGCSLSTVVRAVDFAAQRERLLRDHPDLAAQLMADADPAPLAACYSVDPKVMRWILAVRHDRRRR